MDRAAALTRVAKLRQVTQKSGASEAEAAAAGRRSEAIIARHGLSATEVGNAERALAHSQGPRLRPPIAQPEPVFVPMANTSGTSDGGVFVRVIFNY